VDLNLVVPRTEVVELLAREEGALAVVIGPGGCGKTLSVIKALHDAITSRQKLGGVLLPGPNPPRRSLPELIGTWRSARPMQAESLEASLRRIRMANSGLPRPVLLLALDGIDESRWDERSDAHETIAYFRKMHNEARPAEALLLVTCRTRDQFEVYVGADGVGGRPLAPIASPLIARHPWAHSVTDRCSATNGKCQFHVTGTRRGRSKRVPPLSTTPAVTASEKISRTRSEASQVGRSPRPR
jgi:hypothetical protein